MNKVVSLFTDAIMLLVCVVFFITCKKEYSYEGGNKAGTAVYTLQGAGGTCTGSVLAGNYYAGTSLGSNNSVLLQVDVTTIGTYNLSTGSVNGIQFSGSGTFTTTGVQTITLKASGKPISEGSFIFSPSFAATCSFTVTVDKAPVIMAGFTLGGAPNQCTNAVAVGYYISGMAMTSANTVTFDVNVTSVGAYTITTDTLDGIFFSASGTFTTTGIQRVTLTATGTPVDPRNLTFTPLAGTSSCTFAVTVADPEPLAIYVLESGFGTPSPCIYSVSGNYNFNTPLVPSFNTATIKVYDSTLGNFTIATNIVNGMMFSYTGTYTTTGSQVVTLKGSGTPVSAGTYTFTPQIVGPHPLGGQACAFKITVN